MTAKEKLIVALDVATSDRAIDLFETLRDVVDMFKVGSQLFTACGPDIVRHIVSRGGRVFLDLKFHDIPNTVAAAGVEATRLGVSIFNVHAAGGTEMMKRTSEAVLEAAARDNLPRPAVIAVTVLTSMDAAALEEIGISAAPDSVVPGLARLAQRCGLDGVVASPNEIGVIRNAVPETGFLIVTPGIRPGEAGADDQRRTATPAAAIRAGADYIVVGRPILGAANPIEAAMKVAEEIQAALSDG